MDTITFKIGDYAPQIITAPVMEGVHSYECCLTLAFAGTGTDIVGHGSTEQEAIQDAFRRSMIFIGEVDVSPLVDPELTPDEVVEQERQEWSG